MPARNLNIIILALCISALCYFTNRRVKPAMHVGDALDLIDTFYVDPVDRNELLTAALDGMTDQLDAHSEYIPIQEFESFQDNIDQEFAGIGIFVELPAEGPPVRVITPLVGSPALRAGMRPGDRFIKIGAEDVSELGLPEVSARLKGPPGTTVQVVVQRGEQQIAMDIERATIELESVIGDYRDEQNQWVYRLRQAPSIAYVRVTGFGEKTVAELRRVLGQLNNDFAALIFDVRGNGGGLLDAAVEVSDMFLSGGEIVSTRTRGGAVEDRFLARSETLVDPAKPMAVLVDGNSASASEIVAAALQDHGRAAVVGERTYGKGTVQNVIPLQYGRSALRLTVARFYRPSGESLQRESESIEAESAAAGDNTAAQSETWGVQPDEGLEVKLDDETRLQLMQQWQRAAYPSLADGSPDPSSAEAEPADPQTPSDPQLERAIEALRKQLQSLQTRPAAA